MVIIAEQTDDADCRLQMEARERKEGRNGRTTQNGVVFV